MAPRLVRRHPLLCGLPAVLILVTLHAGAVRAQAPAEFEVASVKPNTSGTEAWSATTTDGQLRLINAPLRRCTERAYHVMDYAFSGPSWLDTERFDIVAKIPAGASRAQIGAMLQALLIDRFQLEVHWAPKEVSGYALVEAKNGSKIRPVAKPVHETFLHIDRGTIKAGQLSMDEFASILATDRNQPVQNLTGMEGVFALTLEWTPDDAPSAPIEDTAGKPAEGAAGPSLFTALQEQLGLRLRAQKVSVPTLVVDRIERVPSAN